MREGVPTSLVPLQKRAVVRVAHPRVVGQAARQKRAVRVVQAVHPERGQNPIPPLRQKRKAVLVARRARGKEKGRKISLDDNGDGVKPLILGCFISAKALIQALDLAATEARELPP